MFLCNCHAHTRICTHVHACARTYTHAMRHLPPCLRDPGALLEDNEEETLSLLEHVRQIRHRRPRRPQIHPSSSCPPNQHCKETERAMGHKVQKRLEIAVKSGNRKRGGGGTEREKYERDVMICLIWSPLLFFFPPQPEKYSKVLPQSWKMTVCTQNTVNRKMNLSVNIWKNIAKGLFVYKNCIHAGIAELEPNKVIHLFKGKKQKQQKKPTIGGNAA